MFARMFESEKVGQIVLLKTTTLDRAVIEIIFAIPELDEEFEPSKLVSRYPDYESRNKAFEEMTLDVLERKILIIKEDILSDDEPFDDEEEDADFLEDDDEEDGVVEFFIAVRKSE